MQSHVLARTATDTVGVSLPLGRGSPRSQEISGEIPAMEALRAPSWGSLFGGAGHSAHPEHRDQVCGQLAVHTELSPIVTHNLVRFSELIISLPLPGPSRSALPQPTAIPGSLAQRTGSDQTARDEQVCGDALETGSSVWGRGRDVGPALSGAERGMSGPALWGREKDIGPAGRALSRRIPGWEAALLLLCVQAPAAHAECSPGEVCWMRGGCLQHCLPASPGAPPHHLLL